MQRFEDGSNGTCVRLLCSSVAGITLRFNLRFPEGTAAENEGMMVESLPRNFAGDAIFRGRCWAVTMGVVIRCTVGAAKEGPVGVIFGQVLFNCVAIKSVDQPGSGSRVNLGRGYSEGECFKPLVEDSLHRMGIVQQDLEHPRPVRDFGHLIDIQASSSESECSPTKKSTWGTKTVFRPVMRSGCERGVV